MTVCMELIHFVIMFNGEEGTQMGNQSVINIEAVIDYIESHLDGKLELETVAEAVHYINSNKPTAGRTKAIHRRLELSFNLYLLLLFVGQNRASKSHLHITLRISRFLQFFNK